jgi:hypothetical protein
MLPISRPSGAFEPVIRILKLNLKTGLRRDATLAFNGTSSQGHDRCQANAQNQNLTIIRHVKSGPPLPLSYFS